MFGQRIRHRLRFLTLILTAVAMLAALFIFSIQSRAAKPAEGAAPSTATAAVSTLSLDDLHALIFVWASGTPAVQQVAQHTCAQLHLTDSQCTAVSAAVRAGWLDMATRDPSGVGHVGAAPNAAGRGQALQALADQLATATGGRTSALLTATHAAYTTISQPGLPPTSSVDRRCLREPCSSGRLRTNSRHCRAG